MAGLYARLDAERARVKDRYRAALRGRLGWRHSSDRDAEVRALARAVKRLDVADNGLCFGRLDSHFRRTVLHRPDRPVRRRRTSTNRCCSIGGRRRRARSTSPPPRARRTCAGAASSTPAGGRWSISPTRSSAVPVPASEGDAALLAAVNAPRGDGMRDIVATIQAEQDEIIRLDHPGVLVIEGGPGTGKTVVALHRVAYLLYTQRERMERHGVLVVGPNPAFLNHIGRVLPSLGESNVVFMTTGDLVPGLHVTAEDTPEAARLKGSLKILDVLAAAVADRQRLPEQPLHDRTGGRHGADRRRDRGVGQRGGARERVAAQRGPRGVPRDRHVGAHRTGDSADRPRLADPGGPRSMGAAAGGPDSPSSRTTTSSPPRSTNSGRS